MRWLIVALFVLAGCTESTQDRSEPGDAVELYRYAWPGSDVVVAGAPAAMLYRISSPTAQTITLEAPGASHAIIDEQGIGESTAPLFVQIEPDAPLLYMVRVAGDQSIAVTDAAGTHVHDVVFHAAQGAAVEANSHVHTTTVGLWLNGTSFYTNSYDLLVDSEFPADASIDRLAAIGEAELLPVFVYDADRTEQPDRSIDNCYFTTIPGYNALLKEQAETSTWVRFLSPEEAYTRAGAEEHFLYGDALVFLNTVVAYEGVLDATWMVPEPEAECYDQQRYEDKLPVPLPV